MDYAGFSDLSCTMFFSRRLIELEPGDSVDLDQALWQDAIVFALAGELTVTCSTGESHRFGEGAILTLARVPVIDARNTGITATRLLAIWRTNGRV
jgi:hypothetical protein